jgi:hypothetical protein
LLKKEVEKELKRLSKVVQEEREAVERERDRFQVLESQFERTGLGRRKGEINVSHRCLWVPANIRHEVEGNSSHLVYGGVLVNPNIFFLAKGEPGQKQTLNKAFSVTSRRFDANLVERVKQAHVDVSSGKCGGDGYESDHGRGTSRAAGGGFGASSSTLRGAGGSSAASASSVGASSGNFGHSGGGGYSGSGSAGGGGGYSGGSGHSGGDHKDPPPPPPFGGSGGGDGDKPSGEGYHGRGRDKHRPTWEEKGKGREDRSPSPTFWGEKHNTASATRLKAYLSLQQEGILDKDGRLTEYAIRESKSALSEDTSIKNPVVIAELTKNGGSITDWEKVKTPSIELSTGQRVQVHFYKNRVTGEVNYNIDFKIKGEVRWCPKEPTPEPKVSPGEPYSVK